MVKLKQALVPGSYRNVEIDLLRKIGTANVIVKELEEIDEIRNSSPTFEALDM